MKEVTPKVMTTALQESLKCSLTMPSTAHSYSIITEFMKAWFIERVPHNYFKHIHTENKHIFDDFRGKSTTEKIKKESPKLSIIPKFNLEYSREGLDNNQFGIDLLMKRGRIDRALIRDYKTNSFIGSTMELLESEFTFMMEVDSKAQQIDLYKYLNMVFSVGSTLDANIDLDYHLPYTLMLQLAVDNGYEVKDDKITDTIGFIRYVNSISRLPIMFKYRTINGKMEYFIRFNDIDVMLDLTDPISADDGQGRGMLTRSFGLEMTVRVKVPSPKFFMYYSSNDHELIKGIDTYKPDSDDVIYPIYSIEIKKVPKINERGWNQYLTTEYHDSKLDDFIIIEFDDMFNTGSDIRKVIDLCNRVGISPNNFIEFKIYNMDNHELPHTMDWDTLVLTYGILVKGEVSFIAIYIDTDYVFNKIKDIDGMHNNRLSETKYVK